MAVEAILVELGTLETGALLRYSLLGGSGVFPGGVNSVPARVS